MADDTQGCIWELRPDAADGSSFSTSKQSPKAQGWSAHWVCLYKRPALGLLINMHPLFVWGSGIINRQDNYHNWLMLSPTSGGDQLNVVIALSSCWKDPHFFFVPPSNTHMHVPPAISPCSSAFSHFKNEILLRLLLLQLSATLSLNADMQASKRSPAAIREPRGQYMLQCKKPLRSLKNHLLL